MPRLQCACVRACVCLCVWDYVKLWCVRHILFIFAHALLLCFEFFYWVVSYINRVVRYSLPFIRSRIHSQSVRYPTISFIYRRIHSRSTCGQNQYWFGSARFSYHFSVCLSAKRNTQYFRIVSYFQHCIDSVNMKHIFTSVGNILIDTKIYV